MEIPGFQESKLHKLGGARYKTPKVVFNRKEALEKAPPHIKTILNELYEQIDYIELVINYYELRVGKRKNPPRDTLLARFSEEKRKTCERKAEYLSQAQYLKLRHRLVELRTEQYTYKDFIESSILPHAEPQAVVPEERLRFDEDIDVRPLGLHNGSKEAEKLFSFFPDPQSFSDDELRHISDLIWKKKSHKLVLNFEDPTQLLELYRQYRDIESEALQDPDQIYSSTAAILRTLKFYEDGARLNDLQRELLHMKIDSVPNINIANYINEKYGTTYNDNYISTIFRRKILPTIAQAATNHKLIMENIFYPENFKRCKDCGRLFLRTPDFFMRQAKAPDGLSPRCKSCQRIKREQEKNKYEIKYVVNRNDL